MYKKPESALTRRLGCILNVPGRASHCSLTVKTAFAFIVACQGLGNAVVAKAGTIDITVVPRIVYFSDGHLIEGAAYPVARYGIAAIYPSLTQRLTSIAASLENRLSYALDRSDNLERRPDYIVVALKRV